MGFLDFLKPKSNAEKELGQMFGNIAKQVFPNGESDIKKDTNAIYALFGGKLSLEECRKFVCGRKSLLFISKDKTAERMIPSFIAASGGKISENEANQAYLYLSGGGLSYSGGDGQTEDTAVIIHAKNSVTGINGEYAYIEKKYGPRDVNWEVETRFHGTSSNGRSFETFIIVLKNNRKKVTIYFDITEFYGKF